MVRLSEQYKKVVVPAMVKRFGYKSVMAVPKIDKVVLNCGFGKMVSGKTSGEQEKIREHILESLALIAGQKPVLTKAKKSIATFKLREGTYIGAKITLRGEKMYAFLNKLINLVLPRTRDFRGIDEKSISDSGTLSIGFKEYTPFPEIKIEKEKGIFGLEVNISTTAKTKDEALELLKLMRVPFKSAVSEGKRSEAKPELTDDLPST